MDDLQEKFEDFMQTIEQKAGDIGLDINDQIIDHVCYRANSLKTYKTLLREFRTISILFTTKYFHERLFHLFMLNQPLVYKDIKVYFLEFSQPGGSDDYEEGFQHIEILTKENPKNLIKTDFDNLLCVSKHGDESYLKWPDLTAIKFTSRPLVCPALLEDNPVIKLLTY